MADLIKYYGTECSHCIEIEPVLKEVEKELNVKIERVEVWHNADNQKRFMKEAEGKCNGVPFFLNKKSGKFICGATDKKQLLAWAKDL